MFLALATRSGTSDKKREKGKGTTGKKTQRPKVLPSLEVPGGYSSKNRQKMFT